MAERFETIDGKTSLSGDSVPQKHEPAMLHAEMSLIRPLAITCSFQGALGQGHIGYIIQVRLKQRRIQKQVVPRTAKFAVKKSDKKITAAHLIRMLDKPDKEIQNKICYGLRHGYRSNLLCMMPDILYDLALEPQTGRFAMRSPDPARVIDGIAKLMWGA